MVKASIASRSSGAVLGQGREALDLLEELFVDGLKYGFFELSVSCEIRNSGKRHLVIRAGKSHMFTIPADEVPH
jgi:hypothetical protein